MRKVLMAFALGISTCGFAQVFTVQSVEKLDLPQNTEARVVAISPQGDYVLLSDYSNTGLTKFDLASKSTQTLTDAKGAGYKVLISEDGQNIIFRETSFNKKHLRHNSLEGMNLVSGEKKELVKASRDLQGYAIEGMTAVAIDHGKMQKKAMTGKAQVTRPVLSINNRQLMITENGKTRVLSPNGQEYSYIWESLSPNGQKVLYYVGGRGAFVCDLDGSNIQSLGVIRAPQWYDDNTVVGMFDQDNGVYTTSSVIKVATLDGRSQTLTDDSQIAMYPVAANGKIVFSTPYGESYLINVVK
ncbi:MAG: hypothetical protein II786_06040 [Muribaculaceae bacterium]|nr:hypothetical protein [Muribaculaceae bacterium]MBR3100454.1 hypothetical protein [Muribaculaceae bacterium]